MKKPKILLIDDEELFRNAMEKTLRQEFEVVVAADGAKGLRLAEKIKPKLILLDILMPEIDGLEVLRRMKKNRKTKNIPVILLTNVDKDESVSEGISLGVRGYMVKADYTGEEILAKVKNFI
ncbi:response regulator [Patescibacteria group bacterium]|nr:response regulator [Patescibacteria group bacterium]MBU4511937.1 response regulator [Patescibacteria group bacterium]MCG2692905.1 response regulator [Candidatus Parcubacteria bacterium]